MSRYNSNSRVYVGDLPSDVEKDELEKEFDRYGPLRSVWVARKPTGFAFIEFEEPRDAEDAVKELDGTKLFGGSSIRVEMADNRRGGRGGGGRGGGRGRGGGGRDGGRRGFNPDDECYRCGRRGHYAYDCRSRGGGGSSSGRRDRDGGRYSSSSRRSYSRSRSRSPGRSYSRDDRSPRRNSDD